MPSPVDKPSLSGWPSECEARLAAFDRRWRQTVPALDELAAAMADCARFAPRQRELSIELVKIDIECRWRKAGGKLSAGSGEPATVENYLKQFSDLAGDDRLLVELAVEEYRARHRWGDSPSAASFAARFPALPDELAGQLAQVDEELAKERAPAWDSEPPETIRGVAFLRSTDLAATVFSVARGKHVDFLWSIKPFSELPESVVTALAVEMLECEFTPGAEIVRQGAAPTGLTVVTEGEVEVSIIDVEQNRRVIDRAGRGTVLGEMALVSNQPHSANVSAVTPVRALILPVESLHRMARQFPPLGAGFANLAAARLGRREVDVLYDKRVNGYRIKRRLGHGGMAVVYEAEEETTGKRVALKMMQPQLAYDLVAFKRFQNEAQTLSRLHHENIVGVQGYFAAHNTSFIVMELCEGPTLARLISRCAPLAEDFAWPIIGQLAAAIAHAHSHGVMHRDLKPGNVLIQWDGTIKLSDFGLARSFLSTGLTVRGEILGTPRYMPPEQLIGTNVDARADVYALGCIAFELIMGVPLFSEPDVTRLLALQLNWSLDQSLSAASRDHPAGGQVSSEMRQFFTESLAIDRTQRTLDLKKIAGRAGPVDSAMLWVAGLKR